MIKVDTVQLELSHLDEMDMREHELNTLTPQYRELLTLSDRSETVFLDDVILCCYGIFADGGMWQVPSNHLKDNMIKYSRATIEVVKDLIKGKYAYSLCLNDRLHARWMGFIGFEPTGDIEFIGDKEYLLYEINHTGGVLSA